VFRGRARKRADQVAVLEAALFVAQTQLLAQVADDASLDGRTTGLVGFNAALVAATIAAKELLGKYWWVPLPALGLSTLILVRSLFGRLERLLTKKYRPGALDLGKAAARFYEKYGERPRLKALKQLLSDLGAAFDDNAKQIAAKRRRLQGSIAVLLAGLTIAAVLIAVHRPTKMGTHAKASTPIGGTRRNGRPSAAEEIARRRYLLGLPVAPASR
jgi:hypothetical protein